MRLRLAPVEYKVCATAECGKEYEGARCPECQQSFDPQTMRKELHDRLVLVDVDPPIYEQTQRCRCTECKNLFDLREETLVAYVQCGQCRQSLFRREHLQKLWQGAETLLQRARKLDRARRQLNACPSCGCPVTVACWCPLSHTVPHPPDASGLSQNPITVWTRTFQVLEPLEEIQAREWRDASNDESDWFGEQSVLDEETLDAEEQ